MSVAEILKTNMMEYGGFQSSRLPTTEVQQRLCASLICGGYGAVQIPVPNGYRILCGLHAALHLLTTLSALGDPSPAAEAREYAARLGVSWGAIASAEPRHPTTPESFVCVRCGKGMMLPAQYRKPDPSTPHFSKEYYHRCVIG